MSRAPNVNPPPTMPARRSPYSSETKAIDGCIVTAREQETDERLVLHRFGPPSLALAAIVGELERLEGDWRVLSFSTPTTIFRDLQGTRIQEWDAQMRTPEASALGKLGRYDLLDPSLAPRRRPGTTHG